ncbi:MAG: hypothetical protein EZS28_009921 [Streblomastix strix]|uniref:Uncharacterized protein n=1 Tax=Streblomastix strix TaxID=222440 RepID=A0A5J4WHS3_9EUKA|nr:MAG: hypothetical protein EZS28_009921 [Streblomastix strix]
MKAENQNLLDAIETKLRDTKRVPFLSRIAICAKIVDRQVTVDHEIEELFERIVPDLQLARRGQSQGGRQRKDLPSGLLICMSNTIAVVIEQPYQGICQFLKLFTTYSTNILSNPKIFFYQDDIAERAYTSWIALSIPKRIPADAQRIGSTEKVVSNCYDIVLDLGKFVKADCLQQPDSRIPEDSVVNSLEDKQLPSNEVFINLTTNEDLPNPEEWLDIYGGIIDLNLDSEFTWPALSTINLLPI